VEVERKASEIASLKAEIADLEAKLAAMGGELGGATAASSSAAGGKGKKGAKAGSGGAAGGATAGDDFAGMTLADDDSAEYLKLKGTERQRTADLREALDKLGREQAQEEAAAAGLKSTLAAITARQSE
jgi:DnaJ-domain-containing protein 1